jgi:hypothetical protein
MLKRVPPRVRAVISVVLAALAASGVTVVVTSDDGRVIVNIPPRAAPQTTPQGDLNAPLPLKDETPPGIDQSKHAQIQDRSKQIADDQLVTPRKPAGAQTWSCKQDFGGHLWSQRRVKPTEWVVHYTAGPGTAASTVAYFKRTRAASSTFVVEPDGTCIQMMPVLTAAPWTQLAANQTSISVEIVTTGYNISRAQWLAMPIFSQGILAAMMRDNMRLAGIPLRHVDPIGCSFIVGWTDHNALECGNNHTDVLANFPYDVLQRQLVDSAAVPLKPSARAVRSCRGVVRYWRLRAGGKQPSAAATALYQRRRQVLEKHGYKCGRRKGRMVIYRS